MPTARRPHTLLHLPIVVLAALAFGCGEATHEVGIPSCSDLVRFEPNDGRRVVPVGGSLQFRVRLGPATRDYEFCSSISLHGLSWVNGDPSVARIERDGAGVWTIYGLKVGESFPTLKHGSITLIVMFLQVVESQDT